MGKGASQHFIYSTKAIQENTVEKTNGLNEIKQAMQEWRNGMKEIINQ
jgi:hypothetical protein